MIPSLPPPLIAFGLLGLVSAPLVYFDARNRDSSHPVAWALLTLVTLGHGGLFYLLERDDPGERPETDGEFMLPGNETAGDEAGGDDEAT